MAVRYGTLDFKPKVRVHRSGPLYKIYISTLRWYGTVNFTKYWYVVWPRCVHTFLAPKKRYDMCSTERFALILSQGYGMYVG